MNDAGPTAHATARETSAEERGPVLGSVRRRCSDSIRQGSTGDTVRSPGRDKFVVAMARVGVRGVGATVVEPPARGRVPGQGLGRNARQPDAAVASFAGAVVPQRTLQGKGANPPFDALTRVSVHPAGGYPTRERNDEMQERARHGFAGPPQPMPHLAALRTAFGHHDVTSARAHVGGPAVPATRALGAVAYAVGDRVAFRAWPDLRAAAHEAAHVIQQRAGVRIAGGIGQVGDAHERHADAVADLVARGGDAEGLLDRVPRVGGAPATAPVIQRLPDGAAGGTAAAAPAPEKETQFNAKLDTRTDSLIQAFDMSKDGKASWNLDVLTVKAGIGLKSSPQAYIEVIGNWQSDASKGSSVELRDKASERAGIVRKAVQQWGGFPDGRLRSTTRSVSIDGTAKAGSYHDIEVWFRTGGAAAAPSYVSPLGAGPSVLGGPPGPLGSIASLGGPMGGPAKNPLGGVPPETKKRIMDLAALLDATGEAVAKDTIVKELRDQLAKIIPFVENADAKKLLEDGVTKGTGEGLQAAIKAGFEALAGQSSVDVQGFQPTHTPTDNPDPFADATIIKTPEFPLDHIPEVKRNLFDFKGVKASYKAGGSMEFTVLTPDTLPSPGPRVVVMEAGDYEANGADGATAIVSRGIESKGAKTIVLQTPAKPGRYVLGIRVGMGAESATTKEFEVTK